MTIILQNNITLLWTVRPRHVQHCDPLISILVFDGITGVQAQLSEYVYYTVTITDCFAYNSITVLILLNRPRKYGLLLCYHSPSSSSRTVPPNSFSIRVIEGGIGYLSVWNTSDPFLQRGNLFLQSNRITVKTVKVNSVNKWISGKLGLNLLIHILMKASAFNYNFPVGMKINVFLF